LKRPTALAVAALMLASCTKVGPSGSAETTSGAGHTRHPYTTPHVLRYATAEDIVSLNPHLAQQTVLGYMSSLTMAWLTKFDHENRPVPELATEVPTLQNGGISKDGLSITWHLRKDAKWSDGVPFTADDVVFSTAVVNNPANNETSRDGWDLITKVDEPDKYTVTFHLKKPYSLYAATFFGSAGANPCILPKHLLEKLPNINNAPYNALPVGIGPFKYKYWKRADAVELVPNPTYFRGQPKLQRILFKIVPDRNTVLTQLQTHEIDLWTPVAAAYFDRVKVIPGVKVDRYPSYGFGHIDMQNQHPGLDDVRVRRALRLAVDRREIIDKIRHGIGILQDNVISPTHPTFDKTVPTVPFDLAQAAKLLDEAGWKPGPNGIRVKDGHALNFTFASSVGTPDADSMLELIRANWQKIGVAFTVRRYPAPLFFAPFADGGIMYGGKWDFVTFQWGGNPVGDLSNLYGCDQMPPNGQNDPRYCNRTVNDAMNKFKAEYDDAKRQTYSAVIQHGIANDAPVIVTAVPEDIFAYNSDMTGFRPNQLTAFDDFMNVDI
jgi:peptide/nickel transport system substrate-binding protein